MCLVIGHRSLLHTSKRQEELIDFVEDLVVGEEDLAQDRLLWHLLLLQRVDLPRRQQKHLKNRKKKKLMLLMVVLICLVAAVEVE
eukprot:gene747-831_t